MYLMTPPYITVGTWICQENVGTERVPYYHFTNKSDLNRKTWKVCFILINRFTITIANEYFNY